MAERDLQFQSHPDENICVGDASLNENILPSMLMVLNCLVAGFLVSPVPILATMQAKMLKCFDSVTLYKCSFREA
jgi:hypothetical protein